MTDSVLLGMIGDPEAASCVDGVCTVPASAAADPASAADESTSA
ncbi:MAG: hypothetical protein ABI275_03710 [Terrimesophilobacter sp.]